MRTHTRGVITMSASLPIGTLYGRNRATYIGLPDGHLANLRPFRSSSAMRAELASYDASELASYGRGDAARFDWESYRGKRTVYVVWSYGTVIAAVFSDGSYCVPAAGYSSSTTRHQSQCRAWLPQGVEKLRRGELYGELAPQTEELA